MFPKWQMIAATETGAEAEELDTEDGAEEALPPQPVRATAREILHRAGITATLRDTRGQDIDGACGQLAAKER